MKIGTFGIMNNPEYRQEPWRESIAQKLECFDVVCIVCGHSGDQEMLARYFDKETKQGKLVTLFKEWPFPEWSYEELPRHLNLALDLVKKQGCDWAIRLDIDTVFHENDIGKLRQAIGEADRSQKWAALIQKMQFIKPTRCYLKGKMPIAINLKKPIAYGMDSTRYTDLCQPIEWNGVSKVVMDGKKYDIPIGKKIDQDFCFEVSQVKAFNYDHTFRTYDRMLHLLYQIEKAHERFWGQGYTGKKGDEITRETSMNDFLELSKGRYSRMTTEMRIKDHPKHMQATLNSLGFPHFGFDLWGKLGVK